MNRVTVEFFGVPRLKAGRAELAVAADTPRDALRAVAAACPGLAGMLTPDDTLTPHYLLSVDGERFVEDLSGPLSPGVRLLLLSADAGG